jgi:hypothetical protein
VPVTNLPFTADQPLIHVIVGVSLRQRNRLVAAGVRVPAATPMKLVVDTGAALSALDPEALAPFGLLPVGEMQVRPVSETGVTSYPANTYHVSMELPAPDGFSMRLGEVLVFENRFRHQGIDGLLGRDVLAHCLLVYNAPAGHFTLAY